MSEPLLSICIPSYNRPEWLARLLRSVDGDPSAIEVVVCEDNAPRREEVRAAVESVRPSIRYDLRYFENERNLGYDANIRNLLTKARGTYVMFMGDDDQLAPGRLDPFLDFVRANADAAYILRSYLAEVDGGCETFRYFPGPVRWEPGFEACMATFRKSVSLSGLTLKREPVLPYLTDRFDGTLLVQLYFIAELTLHYPSVFCDIPVAVVTQTFRDDNPQFGTAAAEKGRFEPGKVTLQNSVNFMKGFFQITGYLDEKYSLNATDAVRRDISKYSYPILSIQRKRGAREFVRYAGLLRRELELDVTPYFNLYFAALLLLGERNCDRAIRLIKRVLGSTPRL